MVLFVNLLPGTCSPSEDLLRTVALLLPRASTRSFPLAWGLGPPRLGPGVPPRLHLTFGMISRKAVASDLCGTELSTWLPNLGPAQLIVQSPPPTEGVSLPSPRRTHRSLWVWGSYVLSLRRSQLDFCRTPFWGPFRASLRWWEIASPPGSAFLAAASFHPPVYGGSSPRGWSCP